MKAKPTKPKATAKAGTAKPDKTPGGGGVRKQKNPDREMESEPKKNLQCDDLPQIEEKEWNVKCGWCEDEARVRATTRIIHDCERCGTRTDLEYHRGHQCRKCSVDFTSPARERLSHCYKCGTTADHPLKGKGKWKATPTTKGASDASGSVEELLFGRKWGEEFRPGLYQLYKDAEDQPSERAEIGKTAARIGDIFMRFMVALARDFQDYDCVRWLAYYSDLGRRRLPQNHHCNIEDMLTKGGDRLRARREWNEVRSWITKRGPKEYASTFATWVDSVADDAWWLHFGYDILRDAAARPRVTINNQEGDQTERWIRFLKGCGITGLAVENEKVRKMRFPLPTMWMNATSETPEYREHLADEVLLPVLDWLANNREADWAESKFPKFNRAEIRRRITTELGKR